MTSQDRRDRADNLRYWWNMTYPTIINVAIVLAVGMLIGWLAAQWR